MVCGQPELVQHGPEELCGTAEVGGVHGVGTGVRVEDSRTQRLVERADGGRSVFAADARRRAQKTEPGGVPGLVLRRELRVVIDVCVQQT